MRLIRTLVPDAEREDVLALLEDHGIDYVVVRESGADDDRVLVEFPLPTQAVETVLDDLRDLRGDDGPYTVVASAETVFSEHVEELEERFVTGGEEDDSIATEELRSVALDMTPGARTYYSMTVLSALVATAGLLLDSPAVVVGSMVIAPLVGSALTASLGTVLNEPEMVADGLRTQLYGLAVAVVSATLFSAGLRNAAFLPPPVDVTTTQQIANRISPGLLSTVVGVCAGAAGAFGLATGVSVTLVGVMIAAALVPAAAAVGIGIAWDIRAVALGAFFLLALNAVAVHLSAAAVLWYMGYRPDDWAAGAPLAGRSPRQVGALVASVLVLSAAFLGSGVVVAAHVGFERDVNRATAEVLAEAPYGDLELVSVHTEFDADRPFGPDRPQQVTVVVARPVDRPYPELSRTITGRVEDETGRSVTVVVEFVERQRAGAAAGARSRAG